MIKTLIDPKVSLKNLKAHQFRWFLCCFVVEAMFHTQSTSSSDHLDVSTENPKPCGIFHPSDRNSLHGLRSNQKNSTSMSEPMKNIIKLQVDERNPVHVDMY